MNTQLPANRSLRSARLIQAAFLLTLPSAALAQGPPIPTGGTVWASGLEGPRGLAFGPDGLLYVAEAGHGGTQAPPKGCPAVPAPVGPYSGGLTARVSKIDANGNRITVAGGLPSGVDSLPTGDTFGVAAVAFLNGTLYALLSGGGCSHGNPGVPNGVVRIDTATGSSQMIANLSDFFATHPVSHPNLGDFEPDGALYDMKAVNGKLVIIEANHGRLIAVDPSGAIQQISDLSAPLGHIVPTSFAWRDGRYYIGMLGHFPIEIGQSNLYHVSADGYVLDYWLGFTTLVDVEVDSDNRLYLLEFSRGSGFPDIGRGRVLRITGGILEEIVTGLNVPTHMAIGPDGSIYVSDLGAAPPGAGRILRLPNPVTGKRLF